ncbi:MAG: glutathione S-transferase family protein [Hyphomicrobiaceae bacterium]
MKVHHIPNTRSVRIIWLLEELGLQYDVEKYELNPKSLRTEEYTKIHPMNRVPSLEDGDVTMFESGAIVQYLLARYGEGRLQPAVDSRWFPRYLQWLHYCEGMLMPQVNIIVIQTILLPEERRNPEALAQARKQLTRMMSAVETELDGQDHLAGEFSAADIMTGHACMVAERLGADVSDKPNVSAYNKRLSERPALVRARAV